MYGLETITPPDAEPVSLELAKAHLRIDHDDDNDWITSSIRTARELTESYCGRRWITQTLRLTLATWPNELDEQDQAFDVNGLIRLPVEPVQSATVKYLDTDKDEQTVDEADTDTWLSHSPPLIGPADEWPDVGEYLGAVRVEFVAGYGATADDVPEAVKTAMLLCLTAWDEDRAGEREMPPAAKAILNTLRTGAYAA